MTNKEAIEILKRATMFEPTLENRDYPEAFDLAIKALEEKQEYENQVEKMLNDLAKEYGEDGDIPNLCLNCIHRFGCDTFAFDQVKVNEDGEMHLFGCSDYEGDDEDE